MTQRESVVAILCEGSPSRPAPLGPKGEGDPAPVPLHPLEILTPFPRWACGPRPGVRVDCRRERNCNKQAGRPCDRPVLAQRQALAFSKLLLQPERKERPSRTRRRPYEAQTNPPPVWEMDQARALTRCQTKDAALNARRTCIARPISQMGNPGDLSKASPAACFFASSPGYSPTIDAMCLRRSRSRRKRKCGIVKGRIAP